MKIFLIKYESSLTSGAMWHANTFSNLFALWSERKQRIHVTQLTQISRHYLRSADILQKGATVGWRGGDKLFNKVVIFVFFCAQKYSRSFAKLRLNSWCHMDYFTDVLAMLGQRSLVFNQKYLHLCSED